MKKLLATLLLLLPALAFAWEPTKPIEVLIGHSPGTVNEIVFRALAAEVEKNTKATFVVINRPGVGGAISAVEISKKPADGYFANMISVPGIVAVDKIAMPNKEYTTDSFVYPFDAAQSSFAIVANIKNPVSTPKQWIESMKNDKVSISANGGARLAYEMINIKLNLNEGPTGVVRVDHKGPVDAVTDVVGGNVTYAIVPALVANTFYQGGRVKIIATTGLKPVTQFPGAPTLNTVIPKFEVYANWGLILPAGTPADVIDWYNKEFNKALKLDSIRTLYANNLLEETPYTSPKSYETYVRSLEKQLAPLVDAVLSKMNK